MCACMLMVVEEMVGGSHGDVCVCVCVVMGDSCKSIISSKSACQHGELL